jgi:two-component sensor histidine kinase
MLSGLNKPDSLKTELIFMEDDTNKVWTYHELARYHVMSNLDSSNYYLEKAEELAKRINYPKGIAYSYTRLATNYMAQGKRELEKQCFLKAKKVAENGKVPMLEGSIFSQLGKIHYENLSTDSAMYYFFLAEEKNIKNGYAEKNWTVYNNMAALFESMGENIKAEKYLKKAYTITKESGDRKDFGMSLFFLMVFYQKQELLEEYSNYLEEYLEFTGKGTMKLEPDKFHSSIFFEPTDNNENKIKKLNRVSAEHKRLGNLRSYLSTSIILSNLYAENGELDRAAEILNEGYETATQVDIKDFEFKMAEYLSKFYSENKDYQNAFKYLQIAEEIEDRLQSVQVKENLQELEVKYETEKKEAEILKNQLALEKADIEKKSLIALVIAAIVLAIILLYFLYFKQKTNRVLSQKNNTIQIALEEKEILLKEIHHRVKNNLQVVSSLLNLQSRTLESESARAAIRDGQNRVKSMALIHQNLYRTDHLTSMDVKEYVSKLSDSLFQSYNVEPERIKLKNEVDSMQMDVDLLVPLGLILNELLSNALKHAFPEGKEGQVQVKVKKQQNGFLMEVSDNGIGINEEKFFQPSDSFGLRMIKAFCEKLKAKMEVTNQNGTHIQLYIPEKAA